MPSTEYLNDAIALFVGAAVAIGLVLIWINKNSTRMLTSRSLMQDAEDSVAFLFDDQTLINATPRARELLSQQDKGRTDWESLLVLLSARFPLLRSQCQDLAAAGRTRIMPSDGQPGWIDAEYWNGLAKLTLVQDDPHPNETIDPLTAQAIEHELETLRCIGEDSPQLIWKHDAEGALIWANRAYIEISEALSPLPPDTLRTWPPKQIFDGLNQPVGTAPVIEMHQISLPQSDDPICYEVTSLKRGTDTIHFAVDATAAVTSQANQRNFVQTLSKTFAELSVGLAIFDADRRLVLFNPALTDLTNMSAQYLVERPTLMSFLDMLRNNQMMPEPKNYTNWRAQIMELEVAAETGTYHETWQLPSGQTYRVTGRPHPNGAIAFLFEDISDEISLTRKYRSQINAYAAALNKVEQAICVFSPSGTLILMNDAYQSLWGEGLAEDVSNQDVFTALKRWKSATKPASLWVKLEQALLSGSNAQNWSDQVQIDRKTSITGSYTYLPDGNHMVTFLVSDRQHFNTDTPNVETTRLKQANQG